MGPTREMPKKLAEASIMAFPSQFEGFGLGLAEGMAARLPAIGFKSTSAVSELISDGVNGFLVTDVESFAEKLKLLMSDKDLRDKLGRNAKESMRTYQPEKILKSWIELIENTEK